MLKSVVGRHLSGIPHLLAGHLIVLNILPILLFPMKTLSSVRGPVPLNI